MDKKEIITTVASSVVLFTVMFGVKYAIRNAIFKEIAKKRGITVKEVKERMKKLYAKNSKHSYAELFPDFELTAA